MMTNRSRAPRAFSHLLAEVRGRSCRKGPKLLLASILVASLGLRLWGIGFGLPNLYHPDEDAVIMPAMNIIKTGDLEPTRMEYGSLHTYVLAGISAAVFALSARDGFISSTDELTTFERGTYPAIYAHPEYFLAARVISAFFGTATVLLIYMLARRLGNERQALIAAATSAFLPDLVAHAHFATTDIPLVFWVTLSLFLLVRAYDGWDSDSMWAYTGAGFACGLATSVKYNGVILAFPLIAVPLLRVRNLENLLRLRVISGPVGMLAGFLSGTPFALLNIPKFLDWLGYSLSVYNAPRETALPSWLWHLKFHLESNHATIFILGIIGLLLSFHHWRGRGIVISSFTVLAWVAIIAQTNQQARMWLPTAPAFILWACLLLDRIVNELQGHLRWRRIRKYALATPLFIVLPLLISSIGVDIRFRQPDVRSLAQKWVETNIAPGIGVGVDYFAPNIDPQKWPITRNFNLFDENVAWYQSQGVGYLIMSQAITDPEQLAGTMLARYTAFVNETCLVETLSGQFLSAPDIKTWIYKTPPCD